MDEDERRSKWIETRKGLRVGSGIPYHTIPYLPVAAFQFNGM
jgi:hypothetical protein